MSGQTSCGFVSFTVSRNGANSRGLFISILLKPTQQLNDTVSIPQ